MKAEYSVQTCKTLENEYRDLGLHRPYKVKRYDAGDILEYALTPVVSGPADQEVTARLQIEKFIGGGFAGQVYKVKLLSLTSEIAGLHADFIYAMKILIPPSSFSVLFRNSLYWVGFQGPFQQQVNPAAARCGALWQKLIRRGALVRFGDESCVKDIHATFVDRTLGSCGELTDWVDGRTWLLEVDDHMEVLSRWKKGKKVDPSLLGSPEYRYKKQFMADFVNLLHDMGAHEFARQYEWSTCKSQPNCLKLTATDSDPSKGLTAIDFRAGLALLPFLPMSPGDVRLIFQGIARGSLVQFDRGNINKLETFVRKHQREFSDMLDMLEELKAVEKIYRNSLPDITHNHIRLLYSGTLWSGILSGAITGWKIINSIDEKAYERFQKNKIKAIPFFLLGLLPVLGSVFRGIWAHGELRKHYAKFFGNFSYFLKTWYGKRLERVINWHRSGRISAQKAQIIAHSLPKFLINLPLSFLPIGIYKFLTSWSYIKEKLHYIIVRPVKLYFNAQFREQWFLDMVDDGLKKRILSAVDAQEILQKIKEPFVQKYLKSLAVHVCLMPTTHIVAFALAIYYVWSHPEMPRAQAYAIGAGIVALFQVIPISPGSIARGLYVLFLVIKERNFKDYSIALFLGFFKYIGYLAFPIQMTYRYPTLARFMAGHWATEGVHVVPVFGESGALLEHEVFCLFYNWPLTLRRHMQIRAQKRATQKPRYWHTGVWALSAAGILMGVDMLYARYAGMIPDLKQIWWLMALLPLSGGFIVSLGCAGAPMMKRVVAAALFGICASLIYMAASTAIGFHDYTGIFKFIVACVWRSFVFAVFASVGALVNEFRLDDK
jgi:hypothetical protein